MTPAEPTSPPELSPSHRDAKPRANAAPVRRRLWLRRTVGLALFGGLGFLAWSYFAPNFQSAKRSEILLHKVKAELLPIAVVEKGTLESAENRDVICKVKAGSKGTFSSTIKWVIDDGTMVSKGQLLLELDDSALQENFKQQSIVVEKAHAEWVKADEDLTITNKQNESDIALAVAALKVSELDLDKFTGYRLEEALNPFGAILGAPATLAERGEYRQRLDDVSGRLKQSESDLEAYRERSAWAERSVKLGYLTPSQSKVEQTKLSGANDTLGKLQKEKYILETFIREKEFTDLRSKAEVARIGSDKATRQARSKEIQAESERKTKLSIFQREQERLNDTEEQIAECKIYSPQDGMVVYIKPESSRFGGSQQGLIAQGEQVKEGQKMMRIPDLRRMQVNTRVHEALVSRIRGDERISTGMYESLRAGMLTSIHPFARLMSQSEHSLSVVRESVRDKEYRIASQGQRATVRVDAYPDRVFSGRVRSVAAVASQADFFSSDVKVYQTLVLIEESVEGLKPDMNSEVTIHVEDATESVLAVPLQAVIGGAEAGPSRKVFVATATGHEERVVVLGKFNDKMIEVVRGLAEGDEVVLNPRVLLGENKTKTRDDTSNGNGKSAPNEGGEKKGGKKGGGGKTKAPLA